MTEKFTLPKRDLNLQHLECLTNALLTELCCQVGSSERANGVIHVYACIWELTGIKFTLQHIGKSTHAFKFTCSNSAWKIQTRIFTYAWNNAISTVNCTYKIYLAHSQILIVLYPPSWALESLSNHTSLSTLLDTILPNLMFSVMICIWDECYLTPSKIHL